MSLKIAVTSELTFLADEQWVDVGPKNNPGRHIVCTHSTSWWHLGINPDLKGIFVTFTEEYLEYGLEWETDMDGNFVPSMGDVLDFEQVSTVLPLRPGTIVLNDSPELVLQHMLHHNPRVASFRTPEFQAFLDKYGIYALRRTDLNSRTLYATDKLMEKDGVKIRQMTTCIYTDGSLIIHGETGDADISDSTWVLERRVDFDESGKVLNAGYILFTQVRSLKRLEESFAKNKIRPV